MPPAVSVARRRRAAAAAAAAAVLPAAGADSAGCGTVTPGCQPWGRMPNGDGGGSCSKSDRIDLRFAYGDFNCGAKFGDKCCGTNLYGTDPYPAPDVCPREIYNPSAPSASGQSREAQPLQATGEGPTCDYSGGDDPQDCVGYKTHFYCPPVDDFQQFSLKGSARVLSRSSNAARSPSGNTKFDGQIDIVVYGSGNSTPGEGSKKDADGSTVEVPVEGANIGIPYQLMRSRAVAWQFDHPDCAGKPAIASFLLYNITLRTGSFGYKNKQPIGNGFMSTCDGPGKDQCNFESGGNTVCIGKEGTDQFNCGKCVEHWTAGMTPDSSLDDYDISVMVTYYGSDSNKHTLTSGSMNPLNFRQFAHADVYGDVYNKAKGKAKGFKPPW